MAADELDEIDHAIVGLLSENSRRTMEDIGARVSLAASTVTRRIARLERLGVIAGYTVVAGPGGDPRPLRAFSELRLDRGTSVADVVSWAAEVSEVASLHRTTGEADVLVAWRLERLERLGELVEELRLKLGVCPVRTSVALETWVPAPCPPGPSVSRDR